ncbi:MAG: glycosyltransferase family 2 protein [bacterium]|nr:glycosyltransferase family 2 protein [bacterium]
MEKVSAILVCQNIEQEIDRCLGSVSWADEIVVIDSFSGDKTVELARKYTDKVFQHEYPGYSRQVERATDHCTGDWILVIDGDEECSPGLKAKLREIVAAYENGRPVGYEVLRRVAAFGKWIDHGGWYPEYKLRFFRRENLTYEHQEVHGAFTVDGPVERLQEELNHYTYETIYSYLQRLNNYTSLQVANKLRSNPDAQAPWTKIVFSPVSHFWRMLVVKGGWKDGYHGLALAALDAMVAGALYLKLWEYRMREKEGKGNLPPIWNDEINEAKRNF